MMIRKTFSTLTLGFRPSHTNAHLSLSGGTPRRRPAEFSGQTEKTELLIWIDSWAGAGMFFILSELREKKRKGGGDDARSNNL